MESKLPSNYYSDHCVELSIGYLQEGRIIWNASDKSHKKNDLKERKNKRNRKNGRAWLGPV